MTVKQIFNQVKSLDPIDRAKLADLILSDLDNPDKNIEKLWIKEVNKRKEEIKSGRVKPRSYQQVMGKYK